LRDSSNARGAAFAGRRRAVIGIDNLNSYYDPRLKHARLGELARDPGFRFEKVDIADRGDMKRLFFVTRLFGGRSSRGTSGCAPLAGRSHAYTDSNLTGFINILEGCRHTGCRHLLYASSSSVYGANTRAPSEPPTMSIIRSVSTARPRRQTS